LGELTVYGSTYFVVYVVTMAVVRVRPEQVLGVGLG
jgi:hypothetical protein